MFYETLRNLDDIQLFHVFDKLLNYKKTESVDYRVDFLENILTSVGIKVVSYEGTDKELLEIRKKKDIESLSKIDSILSEYNYFQKLNSEIEKQNEIIKNVQTFQMNSSVKEGIINNSLTQIESLRDQKQRLRFLKEIERVENVRNKTLLKKKVTGIKKRKNKL